MAIFFIGERYREGAGPLYQLDSRVKILSAVAFAFAITLISEGHWGAIVACGVFVAASILLSRLPVGVVLGRSMLALPFVAVAAPLVFTRDGHTVFSLPILGWSASQEGMEAVATIMLKSWLAVLLAVVLTGVTRPVDLIRGLERLRVPKILAGIIFFMYRYLFVIGDEAHRSMRARDARSGGMANSRSGGSVAWRARTLGNMIGGLFIRSYERAERVYAAMQSRGYDGSIRFVEERTMSNVDWATLIVALTAIGGLGVYARL